MIGDDEHTALVTNSSGRHEVMVIGNSAELLGLLRPFSRRLGVSSWSQKRQTFRARWISVWRQRPYLVVVDVGLPDLMGVDLIPRLWGLSLDTRFAVFTGIGMVVVSGIAPSPSGAQFGTRGDLDRLVAVLGPTPSLQVPYLAATVFSGHPASALRPEGS
jgi:hypothetical protein